MVKVYPVGLFIVFTLSSLSYLIPAQTSIVGSILPPTNRFFTGRYLAAQPSTPWLALH